MDIAKLYPLFRVLSGVFFSRHLMVGDVIVMLRACLYTHRGPMPHLLIIYH